jgi:hypothetical protein
MEMQSFPSLILTIGSSSTSLTSSIGTPEENRLENQEEEIVCLLLLQ